jgi:hypothetical protein
MPHTLAAFLSKAHQLLSLKEEWVETNDTTRGNCTPQILQASSGFQQRSGGSVTTQKTQFVNMTRLKSAPLDHVTFDVLIRRIPYSTTLI